MGQQPGKPKPPGNPPIRPEPRQPQPIEEPPRPIPIPPVERPPPPVVAYFAFDLVPRRASPSLSCLRGPEWRKLLPFQPRRRSTTR